MRTHRVVVAAALVAVLIPGLHGQSKRRLTFVDLLNVPQLSDPRLSPDGSQVLYTVATANWKTNKRVSHIWRVQADGTNAVQLTTGTDGESSARWSPDGRTIAFVTKRADNEDPQIYLLPASGGEARQLTHHAASASRLTWSPDGSLIYFLAPEPKTQERRDRDKAKDDVYAFDENFQQVHLWKVNAASGEEARITSGDTSILEYRLSNDGKKIAVEQGPNPLYGYNDKSEVWVMDADGSHALQLTANDVPEMGPTVSPDDTQVLFITGANDKFETYYNRKIFTVPVAGGKPRLVSPADMPYEVDAAFWSGDGKSIYFAANMGVHSELFSMPASGGAPRQLTNGKHAITGWSMVGDQHLLTFDEPANPGDVWLLKAGVDTPSRVTHVFDYLEKEFEIARQDAIKWKGADGTTVEGLLFYPIGYEPGQKYPLAVETHGGPQASDKYGFGFWEYYPQALAAKGYAVLQPNYRGSTGYGDPFLRDMVGHYFQNAHLDVMTGVDEVIRMGVADPDRMVKSGWSGGGHMTNKIITFTDRFKAAASGAGAANWISMYAQSDTRVYRTPWFNGTPWQKNAPIDAYWNNSPLKDVAKVTTPTLFFVGEQDPRVPMPQAVEMYRALKSNGIPTHLYVAPREPHVWGELRHELFKMNAEFEWFEKYATKRAFTWEKAPDETPAVDKRPVTTDESKR